MKNPNKTQEYRVQCAHCATWWSSLQWRNERRGEKLGNILQAQAHEQSSG